LQRAGGQDLQVTAADLGIGVFARDRLALLRHPELSVHRPRRLREDRLVARAAAAPDGTAPPVEEAQPQAVSPEQLDETDFRLVQLPARGDVAAVLVAVGIADHHLLQAAPALE